MSRGIPNASVRFPVPFTWFRASGPVFSGSASVRIIATVFPGVPLQCLLYVIHPFRSIEPFPFKSQGFTLSASQSQRDNEPNAIPALQCGRNDVLDILRIEWFNLYFFDSRSLRERNRVAENMAASLSLSERIPRDRMRLVSRTRLSSTRHLGIKLLKVLRLDAVNSVCSNAGNEM
jgi:hypothetical protein